MRALEAGLVHLAPWLSPRDAAMFAGCLLVARTAHAVAGRGAPAASEGPPCQAPSIDDSSDPAAQDRRRRADWTPQRLDLLRKMAAERPRPAVGRIRDEINKLPGAPVRTQKAVNMMISRAAFRTAPPRPADAAPSAPVSSPVSSPSFAPPCMADAVAWAKHQQIFVPRGIDPRGALAVINGARRKLGLSQFPIEAMAEGAAHA